MHPTLDSLQERFAALSMREKVLLIVTALLIVLSSWNGLFYQPLKKQRQSLQTEMISLNARLLATRQAIAQLAGTNTADPNLSNRAELSSVEQSLKRLKQQLSAGEKKFVAPQSMANALQDMLKQRGHLRLLKLESLPARPFDSSGPAIVNIYRHGIAITLEGAYFDTLEYLRALENLPWHIRWDSIDYQVKNYPLAETRIQVYTLSFEQDWLGV